MSTITLWTPLRLHQSSNTWRRRTPLSPTILSHAMLALHSPHLFNLLPSNLHAHGASYLPLVSLLRFQRCSVTQHRLRTNDNCMTQAWRCAELRLAADTQLHQWTLPYEQCIAGDEKRYIPYSMWQAALPVWQTVVARMEEKHNNEHYQEIRELVRQPQPTVRKLAKLNAGGMWEFVSDETAENAAIVQRVEVLENVDWKRIRCMTLPHDEDLHCWLVLHACPYL